MEIIVEGHKIDTKDIFSIDGINSRGYDGIVIRMVDKPNILLQEYTDNIYSYNARAVRDKYQRLKKALIEKWEQDKSDLPIFKL